MLQFEESSFRPHLWHFREDRSWVSYQRPFHCKKLLTLNFLTTTFSKIPMPEPQLSYLVAVISAFLRAWSWSPSDLSFQETMIMAAMTAAAAHTNPSPHSFTWKVLCILTYFLSYPVRWALSLLHRWWGCGLWKNSLTCFVCIRKEYLLQSYENSMRKQSANIKPYINDSSMNSQLLMNWPCGVSLSSNFMGYSRQIRIWLAGFFLF